MVFCANKTTSQKRATNYKMCWKKNKNKREKSLNVWKWLLSGRFGSQKQNAFQIHTTNRNEIFWALLNGPLSQSSRASTKSVTKTNRLFNSIVRHPVSFCPRFLHFFPMMFFRLIFFLCMYPQQITQHLPFRTFVASSDQVYTSKNNENMKSID